jgi:hypothetical protein
MSNRNFDGRAIIQRLQNQVYARNLYTNNTTGQTIINNPQTTDGNSSRYVSYLSGVQTEYARGLLGNGETVSVGGIIGIPPFPTPTSTTPSPPTILSFTTVGTTLWTAPAGITSIEYLVVGGGGGSGGGYDTGGGGGGGGGMVLSGTMSVIPGNTYSIIVGDGGIGGISIRSPLSETDGSPGISSSFDTIIALGGSGGYASRYPVGGNNSAGGPGAINPGTASEGGRGGGSAGDSNGAGGGGGGSSGNGSNGIANTGGNGGSGTSSSISGSSVANGNSNYVAVAGASNTGNGATGGGAASGSDENGASGGSGIVVIVF